MVDGAVAQKNLAAITMRDRENLERIEREPFVARVVVQWEDEDTPYEETLYVSRRYSALSKSRNYATRKVVASRFIPFNHVDENR